MSLNIFRVNRIVRRGQYRLAFLSVTTLVAFFSTAHAQSTGNSVDLPPIIVSATGIPTPIDQIASSVTVITSEEIERDQRRTVPDALQNVPGLNVVQTGGPGGATSIFMRGTNPNHVKVIIDGIDAADPSSSAGNFNFGNFLAGDIERIEVLRGPQSGLYGSDAIGGVIAITTKQGRGAPKVTASVEGGSFKQLNNHFSASGEVGRFNYAFNAQHFRSEVPVTPLNILGPGQTRNNDTYNNWTYSTKLGAGLSDNFSISAVARYTDAKLGFTSDDFTNFPLTLPEALQSTTVNHNFYGRAEAVWSLFDGQLKNFFGYSYTDQWNLNANPNPDFPGNFGFTSPLVQPPITNNGKMTKFDWRGEIAVAPGYVVVAGLEHQKDSLKTDSTGFVDPGFNFFQTTTTASNWNNAGYVELQAQFTKQFSVVANVRLDENESFGDYATYRIAPVFVVPQTQTKLKATYGTGFKAASLTQRYVNNPSFAFTANPNLQPETSSGYDYGFEQPLFNSRVNFGATYFRNDIKNLIVGLTTNPLTGANTYTNVGLAKTSGVEAFVSTQLVDRIKVRFDYTRTYAINAITGFGLYRRPGNKASVSTIWTPIDPLTLTASIAYTDTWVDIGRVGTPPRIDAPAFTLVNLAANYRFNEKIAVFARVDNLFNKQYEDPIGFMRPGIGVFGGLKASAEAASAMLGGQ